MLLRYIAGGLFIATIFFSHMHSHAKQTIIEANTMETPLTSQEMKNIESVIYKYIDEEKKWDKEDYNIKFVSKRINSTHVEYDVIYKADLGHGIIGGGKSFSITIDAKDNSIVKVLYFQ